MPGLTHLGGDTGPKQEPFRGVRDRLAAQDSGHVERATHHGEGQSHPVHPTGLLFLHPEMGAPESARSTERPSLKSMPFQLGQQKHTSQCDVSKAKNASPNFPNFFIGAATAQVSYRVLGRSLPQDPGQSQGWRRHGGCMNKQ